MFLLKRDLLIHYVEKQLIDISPFSHASCGATFYYFRLAPVIRVYESGRETLIDMKSRAHNGHYNLPANAFAEVQSLEHFNAKLRVYASIGQPTDIALRGLQLVHGPTLDPTFTGQLKFGIRNLLDTENKLSLSEPIGKLCFFDVSDTYQITQPPGEKEKFEQRASPIAE